MVFKTTRNLRGTDLFPVYYDEDSPVAILKALT